jgi:hypothetical protein
MRGKGAKEMREERRGKGETGEKGQDEGGEKGEEKKGRGDRERRKKYREGHGVMARTRHSGRIARIEYQMLDVKIYEKIKYI